MFSRGSSTAATGAAPEETSPQDGSSSDAPKRPKKQWPLACRLIYRLHCSMKSYLYSDTIVGRSTASLQGVTNIRREFMLYVLLLMMLVSFLIGAFGRHMSNLVCVPYPAVVSLISVDSNISQRYVKWITYWMVFGFVNLVDMLCPFVCNVIPQYHLWRTFFLAWCFCPYKWNGCKWIRESLYTSKNLRILRVIAYVGYEAARMLTVQ